ncbi:Asp-tRNA(Asn)/Glu-tRNA(Gln) amidotransferase subunit GatB [Pedobacter sp.]|nr:Asp-tRNA(Asn)/Glu-tRNA(Gln) amidotransferase subunit GatB [Candidatus Saccharibacteria bacterium]
MSVYEDVKDLYEPTIGIECHVQLRTRTKLFSGADNDARDKDPNTTVSPICFGLPGTLPVLNEEVITLSIQAGLALNSTIAEVSRFERKHYFYPDLPKGYQITQLAEPIIGPGSVLISLPDGTEQAVRIHHAHLEEDAGKLTHPVGANYSLVDLNRAGTPLIEIVSEPDMHSPAAAKSFAQELYLLMTYAGVTDGDLYHGNMRFDVNVSVAKKGEPLGTRTETKNLNSFKSVEKSAEYEIERQIEALEKGISIVQETRGWDEVKQKTVSQRSKADAHDYRYFPDADLPPIRVDAARVEAARAVMPLLPDDYRLQWKNMTIDSSVVIALLAKRPLAELVSSVQSQAGDIAATRVANWCASAVDHEGVVSVQGSPVHFAQLAQLAEDGQVNSTAAKELFNDLLKNDMNPGEQAEARGLIQSNDKGAIELIVDQVLADPASKKAIDDIKAGNERAAGYLVGQAMKLSHGQSNPAVIQEIVREKLANK